MLTQLQLPLWLKSCMETFSCNTQDNYETFCLLFFYILYICFIWITATLATVIYHTIIDNKWKWIIFWNSIYIAVFFRLYYVSTCICTCIYFIADFVWHWLSQSHYPITLLPPPWFQLVFYFLLKKIVSVVRSGLELKMFIHHYKGWRK